MIDSKNLKRIIEKDRINIELRKRIRDYLAACHDLKKVLEEYDKAHETFLYSEFAPMLKKAYKDLDEIYNKGLDL